MKRRYWLALALPWGAGCDRPTPAPAPAAESKPDGLSLVVGTQAILYDPDPSATSVMSWHGDRKRFASPEIGTSVLFLGTVPPRGGEPPEARVKVLDGPERDALLFVPLANVKPAGPIADPYSAVSP